MREPAEPARAVAAGTGGDQHDLIVAGPLQLDVRRHEVTLSGTPIPITPTEFRLLHVLARHPGWVHSTEELLEQVWGETSYLDPGVVSVHMSKLRRKLETDPADPRLLLTVRGVGYKLAAGATQMPGEAAGRAASEALDLIPSPHPTPSASECETSEADFRLLAARLAQLGGPALGLVGREEETEALQRLLLDDDIRLVTLTGTGGTGKTQLAVHLLPGLAEAFDGVFPVGLAAIQHPGLVASTIVQSVGLWEVGDRSPAERVCDFFRHRRSLLVLDNFEQVIAAADLVGSLLAECPELRVLVTSRMPLHLRGEREFAVPPLAVPAQADRMEDVMRSAAVQLFVQRAQAVRRDFRLSQENAAVIGEICRRLEGLPLALELAAARVKLLPPQALLGRLERRLPLLTGGPRDLPERQQTMRDTVAWSYGLLEEPAARLFRRLSVFVGGWSLEAAEKVCNADGAFGDSLLSELEGLVDQSLVTGLEAEYGEARFSMLETIREFAVERLLESTEVDATREGHARFFLSLVTAAEPWLNSAHRGEWLPLLERELDNLRVCLRRSLADRLPLEIGIDISSRMLWFWYLRGRHSEGRTWAETMLAEPDIQRCARERGKILWCAGALAWCQGDFPAALERLEQAIVILREMDDRTGLAFPLTLYGATLASTRDYAGARRAYEEGIEFARAAGDGWSEAFASSWLADILLLTGDVPGGRALQEQSVALFAALGDHWGRAMALHGLAVVLGYQGEFELAQPMFEESAALMQQADDHYALARVLSGAAELAVRQREHERARDLLTEAMAKWREMGNETGLRLCLGIHARLAADSGQPLLAACLLGAEKEPLRTVGSLSAPGDPVEYEQIVGELRGRLGDGAWQQAFEKGKSMPLSEAIELALTSPFPA